MSVYCADGQRAEFPPPASPRPPPERGAPRWRPPDLENDRCRRCGVLCFDHWSVRPEDA